MDPVLLTLSTGDSNYKAVVKDGILYRKEGKELAEWTFYGGAVYGEDFAKFAIESFDRDIGYEVEGIGKYSGKSLKEVAGPVQLGHTLIVSPLSSPRAKSLGIREGSTAYLSGTVEKMERIKSPENIENLLN